MGIIISAQTRVVVQGMTGKEGRRATQEMLRDGTVISCGVTPGKGGTEVDGLPIFDSVHEAKQHDPAINTSVLYVPPLMVMDATLEAIDAGIETIVVVTENVPLKDAAYFVQAARKAGVRLIGPSSVGVISPGLGKLGSIGGSQEQHMFSQGSVGIISKSGGMCAETARILSTAGIGQSTVVGMGGDIIVGSTFTDLMELFERDEQTKALIIFGEIGGAYEELAAAMIKEGRFTKPVIAFISGTFAESISHGLALGHAGAIVEEGFGSAEEKRRRLADAGARVARYHDDLPKLIREVL